MLMFPSMTANPTIIQNYDYNSSRLDTMHLSSLMQHLQCFAWQINLLQL